MIPLPWKLGAAALLLAGVAGLAWRYHYVSEKAERLQRENVALTAQAKRAAEIIDTMRADAQLNQETSHALAERLAAIEPRRPLSVRCEPAVAAAVPTEGGGTGPIDAAAERSGTAPPLRDIGAALEDARVEAQQNNAAFMALQEWEARRSH